MDTTMRISASEAFEKHHSNPDKYVILDVRTPSEYRSLRVKGAQNADFYDGFERHVSHLDKSKTYLLYCASGGRSQAAAASCALSGFEAYNVGSVGDLIQAGFPYERS
jgi:phage shock protein E